MAINKIIGDFKKADSKEPKDISRKQDEKSDAKILKKVLKKDMKTCKK